MDFHSEKIYEDKYPLLRLVGEGSKKFLHGQTTADLLEAKIGEKFLSCWLSPDGNVKAILEIFYRENMFEIIVLCGDKSCLIDGFDKVIFPTDKVFLEDLGCKRRLHIMSFEKSWKQSLVESFYCNQKSTKIFKNYKNSSSKEFMIWKIKQGIPSGLSETNYKNNPYELGLFDLLNFNKGCYLGQEMIAKIFKGNRVKEELRYWESDGSLDNGSILFVHSDRYGKSQKNAGIITSVLKIDSDKSIGLAMVRSSALKQDKLYLSNDNKFVNIYKPIGFCGLADQI